jgi:hypothetical protein
MRMKNSASGAKVSFRKSRLHHKYQINSDGHSDLDVL